MRVVFFKDDPTFGDCIGIDYDISPFSYSYFPYMDSSRVYLYKSSERSSLTKAMISVYWKGQWAGWYPKQIPLDFQEMVDGAIEQNSSSP